MNIFLDTETTGIDATAKACEIAFAITDNEFNILEKHQSLLDPEMPITSAASGIHGLTWEDCKYAPTIEEFFLSPDPRCYGKKFPRGAVVIGHRVEFDMRFAGAYFEEPPMLIDTLRWARRLYPDADDHKLSTLLYALALPRSEGAHRAMADVMSCYHLCKHICARTGMTLRKLAEVSQAPMVVRRFPFGKKHKGVLMEDVPMGYLRWAANNMQDLDMDLKYTIDLVIKGRYLNGAANDVLPPFI